MSLISRPRRMVVWGLIAFSCGTHDAQGQNLVLNLESGGNVVIPHHPSQVPSSGLTIEFWVKVNAGSTGWPVAKRTGSTGAYSVQLYGSQPQGANAVLGPTYFGCGEGPAAIIPQGSWVHVAYVCRVGIGRWTYINGVLADSAGLVSCGILTTTAPLAFGAAACCSSTQFFGRLDNVRLWSTVRTGQEIAANALRELSPSDAAAMAGLIGSWSFNSGTAIDARGVNNGQLFGLASVAADDTAAFTTQFDCNGDGVLDPYQIATSQLADLNSDGVPDICQQPSCADADLFRNGVVNGADLGILLSEWGPANPSTVSDINRDGQVDGSDLGFLLANWGPCPN